MAAETDRRRLLPVIMDAAIELTGAERGFLLVLLEGAAGARPRIRVEVARGFDKETLQGPAGQFSRTVVDRVLASGQGVVTTAEADLDLLDITSLQNRKVRSLLCVPMCVGGRIQGALYLDHRFREGAFGAADLPILTTFADQAGLALEVAGGRAPAGAPAPTLAPPAGAGRAGPGPTRHGRLLGGSPVMLALYREVDRAAKAEGPVLISGETGSGKQLVAEEVHARSPRAREPLLTLGAAACDPAALAALFGPAPPRGGKARPGAVVLREVADLGPDAQAALVEALRSAPSGRERPPRLLATTRHDLRARVASGALREDLYYRLDVLQVAVPALRQRPGDLPLLFEGLVERSECPPLRLSPEAATALAAYAWPGNVRELENELARLAALGVDTVQPEHLSRAVRAGSEPGAGHTLQEVERAAVFAALEECGGNKTRAAKRLGIPRSSLYELLSRYRGGP